MILQHVYRPVLNIIYEKITSRVSEKQRNLVIFFCLLLIFSIQFLAQYVFLYEGLNRGIRDYVICLALGLIILMSVNQKLELIKWRKSVYIPYIITSIMILIATLDHDLGPAYQAFPLVMLIAFMCLFYVWGNRQDYQILFEQLSNAYILFIGVLFIICVFCFPYSDKSVEAYGLGYMPFSINPNGVTKIFLPGVVCGMFLSIAKQGYKRSALYLSVAGLCIGTIILTNSRAGIISIILLGGAYIGILIFNHFGCQTESNDKKGILTRNFALLLVLLISSVAGWFLLNTVSCEIDQLFSVNKTEIAISEQGEIVIPAENNEERQLAITEKKTSVYSIIQGNEWLVKLDQFTAGRITIWAVYFQNMTWRGSDELLFYDTEYAHNQYIELSYKAGILTGIAYLLLTIIVGITLIIQFLKKQRRTKYLYFQLLTYIVFFIISLLDTGVLPFERGFIFCYYLSLSPIFVKADFQSSTK